ncbi:MAG: hypothetical protein Q4P05_09185, partial [Actinomycetaceae bacterium]|nr:hypothetical protein [Actinomycetaceae bacterium]
MESILRIRNRQPYVAARIAVVFFALMTLVLSLVLGAVIPSMADEDGNEVPIENAEGSVSTVEPPQTDGGETSTNTAAELSEEPSASDEAQAPAVEAEQASEGDVADEPAPAIEPSDSENADSPMLSRSLAESDAPEALREAEPTTREVSKPFWCT